MLSVSVTGVPLQQTVHFYNLLTSVLQLFIVVNMTSVDEDAILVCISYVFQRFSPSANVTAGIKTLFYSSIYSTGNNLQK